jgi:hypothetical protein
MARSLAAAFSLIFPFALAFGFDFIFVFVSGLRLHLALARAVLRRRVIFQEGELKAALDAVHTIERHAHAVSQ